MGREKKAAARQISHADKYNPDLEGRLPLFRLIYRLQSSPAREPPNLPTFESSIPRFRNVKDFKTVIFFLEQERQLS